MTPEEELAIINKLIEDEAKSYTKFIKVKEKQKIEDKKKQYQDLLDDKRLGILGG